MNSHNTSILNSNVFVANYSKDEELAMKAKINFASQKATRHPNVISFIGACVDDTECKNMSHICSSFFF